jgi:DNA-binding response OmpR family regulator
MKEILLIEDDLHMCELLADYMNCKGFHITAVHRLDSLTDNRILIGLLPHIN